MKHLVNVPAVVMEMESNFKDLEVSVPFAPGVDVKKLTETDKDPLFVTIEVVNEGVSKSKRLYTKETIKSIEKQINANKPEAYEGHLKESDRSTSRPKPMTLWVGAVSRNIEGKLRLFAKGYVLPYADELKQYLKAAKATSKKVAVSIYGQAQQFWNEQAKAYEIKDFILESIDWARDGSEGVPSLGFLKLTSEMADEKNLLVEREVIVGDITASELKTFNSKVVGEIYDEATEKTTNELTKIYDRELKEKIVAEMKPIQKALKVKGEPVAIISEMYGKLSQLEKKLSREIIDRELRNRVKNEKARTLLKTLIVSEMKSHDEKAVKERINKVLESKEGKLIVSEMRSIRQNLNPTVDNRKKSNGRRYTVISK